MTVSLSVYLVVCSDIEQDDLFLRHPQRKRDAMRMSQADSVEPVQLPFERVQSKMGMKGVGFETSENLGELFFELRVSARKFRSTPVKIAGRSQRVH